jgi:hypothetical protein
MRIREDHMDFVESHVTSAAGGRDQI